jgi:hypothetical protein
MKKFPFIVINKNNMKELHHFDTVDDVGSYLLGRKTSNILVIVNEQHIQNLGDLNTSNVFEIQRVLQKLAVDKKSI